MDDRLYMGELVEPLGFDSTWATEHYGLLRVFDAAESPPVPRVLGRPRQPRRGARCHSSPLLARSAQMGSPIASNSSAAAVA